MTDESEIGTFLKLLSSAKYWVLGIALVATLAAGVFGYPGASVYEVSVPVRVQFPANLTRVPQPDRFATFAQSSSNVLAAARVAGLTGRLALIERSLIAAVSPTDARVVEISLQVTDVAKGKVFLNALVERAKEQALVSVRGEYDSLKATKAANSKIDEQVTKLIAESSRLGKALGSEKGLSKADRILAQIGLLQTNVAALQNRASIANNSVQVESELESFNTAVTMDGPMSAQPVSPLSRMFAYGLRGLIVGLIVGVAALYIPPVRRRFSS